MIRPDMRTPYPLVGQSLQAGPRARRQQEPGSPDLQTSRPHLDLDLIHKLSYIPGVRGYGGPPDHQSVRVL